MEKNKRWDEAQGTESDFWAGMVKSDQAVLRVLADNAEKAPILQHRLKPGAKTALEVGSGPFGLGVIGYVPGILCRIAMDPLPPIPMDANDPLRSYVDASRKTIAHIIGCGEEIPLRDESIDVVIYCNVIDHASMPEQIVKEIHRLLKPWSNLF